MPRVSPITLQQMVKFKEFQKYQTESSCIADATYDPESEELVIEFKKRGTYKYFGVPLDEYVDLVTAASQGKYFNNYIREAGYSYQRLSF